MPRQRLKTITCKPPRTGLRAVLCLLLGAFTQEGAARIGAAIKHCQLTAFFGLLAFAEYNGG